MESAFEKKEKEMLIDVAESIGSTLGTVVGKAGAIATPARRRVRVAKKEVKRAGIRAKKEIKKARAGAKKAARRVTSAAKRVRGRR